jgi:hypothetical protein
VVAVVVVLEMDQTPVVREVLVQKDVPEEMV